MFDKLFFALILYRIRFWRGRDSLFVGTYSQNGKRRIA